MATAPESTVPFASTDPSRQQENPQKQRDPRPTRVLPTNRVSTSKQFDILRAFGAASGPDGKAIPNTEVSKIVNLHAATVGLATPFFVDIGLLQKGNEGWLPSAEVGEFTRAYEWNPESAFHRVSSALRKTWFFTTLLPKLRYNAMSKSAALQELSIASGAGPSFRNQLETLLDYLTQAGLIQIEGDQVRLARPTAGTTEDRPEMPTTEAAPETRRDDPPPFRQTSVATSFGSQAAGVVQFNISVKVDTADFATWEPTRIAAFFAGIAQVLAAKGAVEEKSSRG